jgi:hypothetical protein
MKDNGSAKTKDSLAAEVGGDPKLLGEYPNGENVGGIN